MSFKRVFIGGDTHCGHFAGLTPPGYQLPLDGEQTTIARSQREYWDFFERQVSQLKKNKPFDVAVWNGDLIDGTGSRSGGTELITTDRQTQADMAEAIIKTVGAKTNIVVAGTPYHTGQDEDWEAVIARNVGAQFFSHAFVEIDGVKFDVKHKVGASGIPHGRHTAIAKERLWNLLWAEIGGAPKSNIFIRSHVHYFNYCGGQDWLAMTLPALQGLGSKYGARQCSGTVDFGFTHFDIQGGVYRWKAHILKATAAVETVKL